MKISRKRRAMILNAIGEAMTETISDCLSPEEQEELAHPPDSWSDGIKQIFDLLSEFEYKACVKVEKVLNS